MKGIKKMTGKEVYKKWAPTGKRWVDWIRPVPFIGIDTSYQVHEFINDSMPKIFYIDTLSKDTAIIIDIEGVDSIKEGIVLAYLGYCPIPIFNGTNPSMGVSSTTNNAMIGPLLVWGALQLEKIELEEDAPPVFLLDRNRLNRYKMDPSIFDNSWDIYPQDIPSAEYFLQNGITKIMVRGNTLSRDLKKVLYPYQKKNIKILFTNGYEKAREIRIKKIKEKEL